MVQCSPVVGVELRGHPFLARVQRNAVVPVTGVVPLLDQPQRSRGTVASLPVSGGPLDYNHVEVGLLVPTVPAPGAVQDDALGPGLGQEFPADGHCGGVGALMHHLGAGIL